MTEYNIRLNPNCASVVNTGLKFKSGDKGIIFVIVVDELNTAGVTAKIVFQRANGTSVESDITGTDGVFTYKTLGNEFAVPGKTVADVKFYAADTRVSTASFVFEVSADTMDGLGAGAGGYSDRLEQLVTEAEKAGELTEQARAELEEAESDMKETEAEMAAVLQKFKEQYGEVGALNPRGNWNSGVTYQIRDVVFYMGYSWICLIANKGNAPVEGSDYWMKNTDLDYSNENLLVNVDFKNPVNSSGKTSWTSGTTIDKWECSYLTSSYTVTLSENGITFVRTTTGTGIGIFRQNIYNLKNYAGKNVTVSFKINNAIYTYTHKFSTNLESEALDTAGVNFATNGGYFDFVKSASADYVQARFVFGNDENYTIEWVKLELGSVATPFIPPNPEVEKLKCGVANADTVGGYRANDFAKTEYFNSAGDFTFMQAKYKDNWYRLQLKLDEVQIWESVDNGTTWTLKARLDKDFLPLTGGTITGNDLFLGNGYGRWMSNSKCIQLVSINEPNGNNARWLEVKNSNFDANVKTAFQFREMINGNITDYIALHTGNSLKVQASNDAPTDTATMWYDTANKTWKRYVDGAWTAA